MDPDGRADAPYNVSLGDHDCLPTFKGINTGNKWYNKLFDGIVNYALVGTYNLVASLGNVVSNGVGAFDDLVNAGIDWLDKKWPLDFTFTGYGVQQDLETFKILGLAQPYLFYDFFEYASVIANSARVPKEARAMANLISNSMPGPETSGRTTQFIVKGDFSAAIKEFYKFDPKNVIIETTEKGTIYRGILDSGRKINVRNYSSGGWTTLEIQEITSKAVTKFRFE